MTFLEKLEETRPGALTLQQYSMDFAITVDTMLPKEDVGTLVHAQIVRLGHV